MEEGDITAAVTMSERENAVTMARKVQQVQAQAAEETQRELSYSQLVRVGRMIVISSVRDGIVSRQADEFCVILTDKPEKAGGFSVCFPIL